MILPVVALFSHVRCSFISTMTELFHIMSFLFIEFHQLCVEIHTKQAREAIDPPDLCSSCKKDILSAERRALTVEVVLNKLGMSPDPGGESDGGHGDKCEECALTDGASLLLEEKEASVEELEEAFLVFDRDQDGFVTPMELRAVMRGLGFEEGFALEECTKMVSAFDEDGDGRICFSEFKKMMECAG